MSPFADRMQRARAVMAEEGITVMLLSIGPELPYLIGYEAMDTERLTMLVMGPGDSAHLIIPELEAPRVATQSPADVITWTETDDPLDVVAGIIGDGQRMAIGDRTRSRFLLGLQERLPRASFVSSSAVLDGLRVCKDRTEIEALRAVARAADRVAERLGEITFAGRTESEVAADLAAMLRHEGHETVEFTIVASGPNGASPHHEPGLREMQLGDAVVLDFGGRLHRYCSDITRNVVVGDPPDGYAEVHRIVAEAHAAAVATVRPGVQAQAVDRAARDVIQQAGLGDRFIHRTGHGIGLEGHEPPYIVAGNETRLEPGMAFSIEPGVYLPERFGVRIEDIVVVTDSGVELLNTSPREYLVV